MMGDMADLVNDDSPEDGTGEERMKPILIGEQNPFGNPPKYDLWPDPIYCSGGRLMKILGLSKRQYLRTFDRRNLCRGKWAVREARTTSADLIKEAAVGGGRDFILLGAKVCLAFGVPYKPFLVHEVSDIRFNESCGRAIVFPHPSGRNLIWNTPGIRQRARDVLIEAFHPNWSQIE